MTATMAHEMRTPLSTILQAAELLLMGEKCKKKKQFILMIKTAGKVLNTEVNDYIDHTRLSKGTFKLRE